MSFCRGARSAESPARVLGSGYGVCVDEHAPHPERRLGHAMLHDSVDTSGRRYAFLRLAPRDDDHVAHHTFEPDNCHVHLDAHGELIGVTLMWRHP